MSMSDLMELRGEIRAIRRDLGSIQEKLTTANGYTPFSGEELYWIRAKLPDDTVYTAAVIGVAMGTVKEWRDYPCFCFFYVVKNCWFPLLMSWLFQWAFFAYFEIIVETGSKTCTIDWKLRLICQCIFTLSCFKDVLQTIQMFFWMLALRKQTTNDRNECLPIALNDNKKTYAHGFTTMHQISNFFILFVKLLITGMLWWRGSQFLSFAKKLEDIFFNTVSAIFILDIDELVYSTYVSDEIKKGVKELPPLFLKPVISQKDPNPYKYMCSQFCLASFTLIIFCACVLSATLCLLPGCVLRVY
eukprot:TRINITY_DN17149_c0_g1_i1.p1 TRINITY_DN17149_c0_g1~~TRINITY_DN17149_c0_g1_i1.p1  ORF type:complete len:302 (+),score=27.55 TRINITY_DN17149_c0_g1_i1:55-960(+)